METRRKDGPPLQIRLFEALMIVSIALGAVYLYLGLELIGEGATIGRDALIHILFLAVSLLLTLAVSRGRSNLAKYLLILVFLLCAGFAVAMGGVGLLEILEYLLELIALALLFTPPAVAYLEHKPSSV